jgi:hypothetical protein
MKARRGVRFVVSNVQAADFSHGTECPTVLRCRNRSWLAKER